jgi:hypothetical protein
MATTAISALWLNRAASANKAKLHIGAVAVIHRFGSSLNVHVHVHVCAVDGVFAEVAGEGDADAQALTPGVILHPASEASWMRSPSRHWS